jgi:hypothetical protein
MGPGNPKLGPIMAHGGAQAWAHHGPWGAKAWAHHGPWGPRLGSIMAHWGPKLAPIMSPVYASAYDDKLRVGMHGDGSLSGDHL